MKKIWEVYLRDLKKILHNGFALVIVLGIMVIPALYAWFNINSNWDPYSNTDGIKIAVANEDNGAELEGLKVNVGGMIVDKLTENKQIGWQFVNEDEAMQGINDSSYYAAIVIPEDFSEDMLSIAKLDLKQPQIEYYVNEKKNAIAPKITNAGVNTVQLQVNETFIETVSSVLSTLLQDADQEIESKKDETADKVVKALREAQESLAEYQNLLDLVISSTSQLDSALGAAGNLLPDTSGVQSEIDQARQGVNESISSANDALNALSSSTASALSHIADELSNAQDDFNQITDTNDGSTLRLISNAIGRIDTLISLNNSLLSALQNLQSALPSSLASVDAMINKAQENAQNLNDARSSLQSIQAAVEKGEEIPQDLLSQARSALDRAVDIHNQAVSQYENSFSGDLSGLQGKINEKLDTASGIVAGANTMQGSVAGAITDTRGTISSANQTLDKSRDLLKKATDKLEGYIEDIENAGKDEKLAKISELVKRDPSLLSTFLKEPVALKSHSVYKIENYGSGMAPFYTVLAIWVGALVNVAIIKTKVKDEEEFGGLTPMQAYFGRYMLFATVSIIQALVICLGDLYMLKIQCLNPGLFILMGIATAITYSLLMYTLTISFGDVGKALAVILMVVQVAGSGGTFPIETLPDLYQNLYPFFPFNFSINGMRECVAGLYGNAYWMDMLKLTGWIAFSLVIGLVLRKPIIHFKEYVENKVEETGFIG